MNVEALNDFIAAYNDTQRFPTVAAVAQGLGLSVSRVKSKASEVRALNRAGVAGIKEIVWRSINPGSVIEIEKLEDRPPENIEDLIERVCAYNEQKALLEDERKIVEVRLSENGWFGVAGIGDRHMNNPSTQLRRVFSDAKTIAATPGLYAVDIGDGLDNFLMGRLEKERRGDVMSHDQSWLIQSHYWKLIHSKIIGAVLGNHDAWVKSLGGVDALRAELASLGIANVVGVEEQWIRIITTGGEEFVHLLRHGFPGHSKYHPTHGILAWALERYQGEDAFWGGHIHQSGHMYLDREWMGVKRTVHLVQLSAYKKNEMYAKQKGFRRNDPFETPILLINASTRETLFVPDFALGVNLLNSLRTGKVSANLP